MASSKSEVHIDSKGKKRLIPLENNPEVFTDLIQRLGISNKLAFYDVYSIDEPELLAMVPRPCHALIFISPGDIYHRVRANDKGSKELTYDGSGEEEPVMWFKQTIGNTCGLIALLHSVSNGPAKEFITKDSLLDNLLKDCLPAKPMARADVLYNSQELEDAHMASASMGDTSAPEAREPVGYHFIAFAKGKDGHLYELEGSWDGPIVSLHVVFFLSRH